MRKIDGNFCLQTTSNRDLVVLTVGPKVHNNKTLSFFEQTGK